MDRHWVWDDIDSAIERVTGYNKMNCEGWCFPPMYRAWMGHMAFELA